MSKREQQEIPGTERKKIAAVERAANAYREVRDERMELTKKEVEKRTKLAEVMQENGITIYKFDGDDGEPLIVEIDTTTKVKVKKESSYEDEEN